MTRRCVSPQIKSGSDLFMHFLGLTEDMVREKAYPLAAIYRLAGAGGRTTLVKIVDLAYNDWKAEQPKPIEQPEGGHSYRGGPQNGNASFSAPIVYVQPKFKELKRRFTAYVDRVHTFKFFVPIERCKAVSKENREATLEYVHMNRDASTDEVLAEMDRKGLRPALYEELLGFAEKYPDEQLKYPIVALGSESHVFPINGVACLWRFRNGRSLIVHSFDGVWHDSCRFLAVRK